MKIVFKDGEEVCRIYGSSSGFPAPHITVDIPEGLEAKALKLVDHEEQAERWIKDAGLETEVVSLVDPEDESFVHFPAVIVKVAALDEEAEAKRLTEVERRDLEVEGLKAEELCKRVYRMIIGYNKLNLTVEQINAALTQYGVAVQHLRNYFPTGAKAEIGAEKVDDVYPLEFKNKMLAVFNEAGY